MSAVVFPRIFMMSEIYVSEIFDKLEKENTKFVRKPQKKKRLSLINQQSKNLL